MVSTTDDKMSMIMDRLERHGLRDNTIVIFMSDNGHSEENYKIRGKNHTSGLAEGTNYGANGGGGNTGKWRGQKSSFLEGGIRVPAVISYPAKLGKGIVRDQAITAMDWMPTILDLCNVARPDVKLDGKSLLLVIKSESAKSPYGALYWQWGNRWAVRQGDWKLIGKDKKGQSLGNLSDPQPEKKNYIREKPDIAKRLQALHAEWLKEVEPKH